MIQTVDGEKAASELGVILPHEHLYIDTRDFYVKPKEPNSTDLINLPFQMRNLQWIRQNPYSHKPNLSLIGEEDAILEEMSIYKKLGGQTIVENTTVGIDRNIKYLLTVAQKSGINIIAGTGFYVDAFQTESVKSFSEEKMASLMRSELLDGVDGIKCGVIGEVGTTWPITDFEKRSLRSSAMVQDELGAPIIIHPGRNSECPAEIMRIILEAGAKAEHSVMSHLDRTLLDHSAAIEFASFGCYLEYDLFGTEVSHYQLSEVDMPSDAQRIGFLKALMDAGYEDRLLVSHDIHTKHKLLKYGGHGYSHILINVVPKMLKRNITQSQIDKMLEKNPQKWLQFFK